MHDTPHTQRTTCVMDDNVTRPLTHKSTTATTATTATIHTPHPTPQHVQHHQGKEGKQVGFTRALGAGGHYVRDIFGSREAKRAYLMHTLRGAAMQPARCFFRYVAPAWLAQRQYRHLCESVSLSASAGTNT